MELQVKFDDGDFARLQSLFAQSPEIFGKAVRGALRRAGGNMRKEARLGIKGASFLKPSDIARALGRLQLTSEEAMFTVADARLAGHKFRLVPNRRTARKGVRSVNWPLTGVRIGPSEPIRYPQKAGFSKPFVAKVKGQKVYYWREKATGDLKSPPIVSPQYFAAFDRVKDPVMAEAEATFLKRLEHEIDYRLGLK